MPEMITDDICSRLFASGYLTRSSEKKSKTLYKTIIGGGGGRGLSDMMGGSPGSPIPGGSEMSPEDYEYFVDIIRKEIPQKLDPETGEILDPGGWEKNVHRYRKKKDLIDNDNGQPVGGSPDWLFPDIDPLKYSGEGFFSTDEYFPQDIGDPYVRGDVTAGQGAYYPHPDFDPRQWPPFRGMK